MLTQSEVTAEIDAARERGDSAVEVRVEPFDEPTDELLRSRGFVLTREILQLRRPLPADPVPQHRRVTLRPFDPAHDVESWLQVNNRAFAWHPDQAGRSRPDLEAELASDWFDPAGFLVATDAAKPDSMLGFCWTKQHRSADPPDGEIYVIGVDPDHHGRGLGRLLVLAGLHHLHEIGLRRAMLWVEADNTSAIALYRELGFGTDHSVGIYRLELHQAR